MKGALILTEARSGSNWLGSAANATGVLGNSAEWFASHSLPDGRFPRSAEDYIKLSLEKAATSNGFFAVKLFPSHVHQFSRVYGQDLIRHFMDRHETLFVRLTRNDRLRQAISYARGVQSGQWTSRDKSRGDAEYDFDMICRCYFLISQSYQYWESYAQLLNIETTDFVYEDLIGAHGPYLDALARHAGVVVETVPEGTLKIQRDEVTDEWLRRFQAEVQSRNIVPFSTPSRPARKTVSNVVRLIGGRPMKPYPYTY